MGAVYAVDFRMKSKNKKNFERAVKSFARANIKDIDSNFRKHNLDPKNTEDIIRYLLCGIDRYRERFSKTTDRHGFFFYSNCFDASYQWKIVLMAFFNQIGKHLQDNSMIYIEPDNDYDKAIIKKGKTIWIH